VLLPGWTLIIQIDDKIVTDREEETSITQTGCRKRSNLRISKNEDMNQYGIDKKQSKKRHGGRTIMVPCTLDSRLCVPAFRPGCPLQMLFTGNGQAWFRIQGRSLPYRFRFSRCMFNKRKFTYGFQIRLFEIMSYHDTTLILSWNQMNYKSLITDL
jgi:hypothetical protein